MPSIQNWDGFKEATRYVFNQWTALTLAIEESPFLNHHRSISNETGGPFEELLFHTLEFFRQHGSQVEPYELEQNFDDYIIQQLDVEVTDGSLVQVGKRLVELYRKVVCLGDLADLEALRSSNAERTKRHPESASRVVDECDGSSSDEDSVVDQEMEDVQEPTAPEIPTGPIVDEDGFELVQNSRNNRNRRRNHQQQE